MSRHFPDPQGSAAGRILLATCEGLMEEGHDVLVHSWGPDAPAVELPSWCDWLRVDPATGMGARAAALTRPRPDALRAGWRPAPGSIPVADDPVSFPPLEGSPRSVVTFHYLTALDAAALGRRSLRDLQDRRSESRAAARAGLVLAYSPRVVEALPARATFVPVAYPTPAEALPTVEEPIAALLADWRWAPNRIALARLLEAWPEVRSRVPSARLLLAGRGSPDVRSGDGVELLGCVTRSEDVLGRASVVAFPVPDTSGPKIKVLEALGQGIPAVTTRAGIEGLVLPERAGAIVADRSSFARELADLLADPERRAEIGRLGRQAILASHAPRQAARARVAAIERTFPGAQA